MEKITLTVSRADVYAEVDKTTDYTGAKLAETDGGARDRIAVTDNDLKNLYRFWEETCATTNERLKEMFVEGSRPSDDYSVTLQVSVAFNKELLPSVEAILRSYFITSITGKWFVLSNKAEAAGYHAAADNLMEDVRRLLYSRMRPVRPEKTSKS